MLHTKIQEVFGQFAVVLEDGVSLFATEGEAATALSAFENGAQNLALATEYATGQGLEGKNAKGKINVVLSFLNWVDAGQPEAVSVPIGAEDEVATATDDGEVTF